MSTKLMDTFQGLQSMPVTYSASLKSAAVMQHWPTTTRSFPKAPIVLQLPQRAVVVIAATNPANICYATVCYVI
jgi:hypothetical protein